MSDELLTPKQRKVAYLVTVIGNGMLVPLQASVVVPVWGLCLIGGWNAAVAALALSNVATSPGDD